MDIFLGSGDGFPQMGTAFTGLRKLLQSVLNNNFSHALALHAPSQFGWKSSKKQSPQRKSFHDYFTSSFNTVNQEGFIAFIAVYCNTLLSAPPLF